MNQSELIAKIDELQKQIDMLKSFTTIPFDTEQAFRSRLGIDTIIQPSLSSKLATSEDQTIDEGGSATYEVLKSPDAFIQVTINEIPYYIPVFT